MCKAPLEHVFVFDSPEDTRPYASLQIWGTEAGPGMVYDDRAQLFMPKAFMDGVFKPIQAPNCPVAGCGYAPSPNLPYLWDRIHVYVRLF